MGLLLSQLGGAGAVTLDADIEVVGELTAALSVNRGLQADIEVAGELTAAMAVARTLAADLEVAADLSPDLRVNRGLTADLEVAAELSPSLAVARALQAEIEAAFEVTADLTVTAGGGPVNLDAVIAIVLELSGDVTVRPHVPPAPGLPRGAWMRSSRAVRRPGWR